MITLHTILYGDFHKRIQWFKDFQHPLITEKLATITNIDKGFEPFVDFPYEFAGFTNPYFDPYMGMIRNTTTDYVLHVAPDCMGSINIDNSFFTDSLEELHNPRCIATLVNWGCNPQGEEDSTNALLGRMDTAQKFYRRVNFTDQFFLAKTDVLRKADYGVQSNVARRIYGGPPYGVNSFEERLVGYQISANKFNSIHKGDSHYVHRS